MYLEKTLIEKDHAPKRSLLLLFNRLVMSHDFATPWTAARQAPQSFTISLSLLKLMSLESVMPSNHLILCHPLLFPTSIFPSIRVFSSESALHIRWPNYWSFSISPSNEYSGLISFRILGTLSRVFFITIRKHRFMGTQPSLWSSCHIYT